MNSNVFAVDTRDGIVLIDSGFSRRQYEQRHAVLKQWKLNKQIKAVLLTHAHFDHTGNAFLYQQEGAVIVIGAGDAEGVEQGGGSGLSCPDGTGTNPFCRRYVFIGTGDTL